MGYPLAHWGFTEVVPKTYVVGLIDLLEICRSVRRVPWWARWLGHRPQQIILRDLNPQKFWQLTEVQSCLEDCSEEVGPGNLIYLPIVRSLPSDHPVAQMASDGVLTIRYPVAASMPGFRLALLDNGAIVTLMRPNENSPKFPLIQRQEESVAGLFASKVEEWLDEGYYAQD